MYGKFIFSPQRHKEHKGNRAYCGKLSAVDGAKGVLGKLPF